MIVPLQNYKTNKLPIIIAVIVLFFFYSGIIYAVTFVGHNKQPSIGQSPTTLVMHHVNLAGIDDAKEVTNQHDDEEVLSEPAEPEEEKVEEVPKEEVIDKPLEEKIEVIKEAPNEILTIKESTPESPKVQKQKQVIKKAVPPKKIVQNKPAPKRQSKRVQQNVVVNSNQVHVISQPKPAYPRPVMVRNLKGITTVLIKIDKNGRAVSVTIARSSGNKQMDDAALKAAMKTRIKPYIVDGQPIELTVRTIYERN